ncbi:hypothetical protein HDU86_003468 [Geranomyces michiganensis]|nr:hypothetical protein HDU86_003468 [Geranomyces michiganensis]
MSVSIYTLRSRQVLLGVHLLGLRSRTASISSVDVDDVFLFLDDTGRVRVKVDFTCRLLKGKRLDLSAFKGAVFYEYDYKVPGLDVTKPLLALCFRDDIFVQVRTPAQLYGVEKHVVRTASGGFLAVTIKDEWKDVPIMRYIECGGGGKRGIASLKDRTTYDQTKFTVLVENPAGADPRYSIINGVHRIAAVKQYKVHG